MKNMTTTSLIICLCLTGGCATSLPVVTVASTTEDVIILDYEVGVEYQSTLGEVIASARTYSQTVRQVTDQFSDVDPATGTRFSHKKVTTDTTVLAGILGHLVYMGIDNSVMTVKYREFTGENYIRKDFELDLEYDLSESSEVTFRGLTIEILDISPSSITYRIEEDDGQSLLPRSRQWRTIRKE